MDKKQHIAIIGGGAAGLMAAITAANKKNMVSIFEGNDRVGKKILVTGNGKCNLGNTHLNTDCFYCKDKTFLDSLIKACPISKIIHLFENMGLMIREKDGYLYPYSEQASAVLDVLRYQLDDKNVIVKSGEKVTFVKRENNGFRLTTENGTYYADKVIITTGGKSAPKTGSDGSGYLLAKKLGHNLVETVPALVQLRCKESYFGSISGVRAKGVVHYRDYCEAGEIQFTDYGISGIAVFQLSRMIAYELLSKKEVKLELDLLPEHTDKALEELLNQRLKQMRNRDAEHFFTGILNKKLMKMCFKLAGIKEDMAVTGIPQQKLFDVLHNAKQLKVTVIGTNSFDQAQVTAGGVDIRQIKPLTMESQLVRGLYFAGEILDVDGKCGGYNLYFAWATGYLAGISAVKDNYDTN